MDEMLGKCVANQSKTERNEQCSRHVDGLRKLAGATDFAGNERIESPRE